MGACHILKPLAVCWEREREKEAMINWEMVLCSLVICVCASARACMHVCVNQNTAKMPLSACIQYIYYLAMLDVQQSVYKESE